MKGRRPEDIIGEWGVRDVTPPSQKERRQVEADRDLNPLVGKPLRRRLRNFSQEADSYLASLQQLSGIVTGMMDYATRLSSANNPRFGPLVKQSLEEVGPHGGPEPFTTGLHVAANRDWLGRPVYTSWNLIISPAVFLADRARLRTSYSRSGGPCKRTIPGRFFESPQLQHLELLGRLAAAT